MRFSAVLLLSLALFFLGACSKPPGDEPPKGELYVPTAFTPDGDGVNDIFMVKGKNISTFLLQVHDENNKLIFETRDINTGWDGTIDNKQMPANSYPWLITYTNLDGKTFTKAGFVELIR
ncbi:MAG: gliding motility-associated C-terminal domain-containing protein [Bacteroidota bacterium]|nr:gliding motility-associated C-terminal domain-containing protein [Bacteroidota bacterium]